MEVRAKKALGQHFLTDQSIARRIVDTLSSADRDVLEIGPGMGVLTQYLLQRDDIDLKAVELDGESVDYLLTHFPGLQGRLLQADFLRLPLERIFPGPFRVIGNFPYNISSQIFFKILDTASPWAPAPFLRLPKCSRPSFALRATPAPHLAATKSCSSRLSRLLSTNAARPSAMPSNPCSLTVKHLRNLTW